VRRCAFCGSEIAPNAPPEHVIPKWVSLAYPGAMFTTRHNDGHQTRETKGKVIDITADTVCRPCNHGWMSDLESANAPRLKPMLRGENRGLSVQQQESLARWATKTAMTLDQTYRAEERVFTPSERSFLMGKKFPPPGTGVQLGLYSGTGPFLDFGHNDLYRLAVADPANPGPPDGHRTAIRIDKLIVEVNVTSDGRGNVDLTSGTPGVNAGDLLLTIWPSVAVVAFPPKIAMGDATWTSFVEPDLPDAANWDGPGHRGLIQRPPPPPT
jgi:hypothetical protein